MTAAFCLTDTDRVVWCWLTQIITHQRASLVTDPASRQLSFLGTSQQSFLSHIHVTLCQQTAWSMMILWLWNVWWYQQTVDVHSALHRCCYLVLTMCWRQWHLCRSSPPIPDLWGADHKQGCQLSPRHWAPDQAHWTLRHVLGWAWGSGAAAYISQYALFPSSPVVIRYNTDIAFWITYYNFIACKRRVNRVTRIFRIFIGSTLYNNLQ